MIRPAVVLLYDAVQRLTSMILHLEVRDRLVAQLPLGQVQVIPVAAHQKTPVPDREHLAGGPRTGGVQLRLGGKEIPAGGQRHTAGGKRHASGTVNPGDDEIDVYAVDALKDKRGPLLALGPHLLLGNQDAGTVRNHRCAIPIPVKYLPFLRVPHIEAVRVHARHHRAHHAASPVGRIDGVPLLLLSGREIQRTHGVL